MRKGEAVELLPPVAIFLIGRYWKENPDIIGNNQL